jgi:sugar lactone lactonase YvrE
MPRRHLSRPVLSHLLVALVASACGAAENEPAATARNQHTDSVYVVFTIPEPDLLPENVAHDPVTGAWFVGSTRKGKILRVAEGRISEFRGAREDGLWMVVGMKADPDRRVLWVCSSQGDNLMGDTIRDGGAAALYRFDLDSGTMLDRWALDTPGVTHFLNDVVLASDGTAFVTHMFDEPGVWSVRPGGVLEPYVGLPERSYPNGIALSPDESALFVATSRGILRVDLRDRSITTLRVAELDGTSGIDGLYAIEGALIGVRPEPGAVVRFDLAADGQAVTASTVLVEGHSALRGPTTGVIVGDELHFIANAQFDMVAADGSLPSLANLADPVVLAVPLVPGSGASR